MVSFAWLFFLLFKTNSNTVTLCSLKTKQEEVESLTAAWGLAMGVSSDVAAQQGSCRARTLVSFRFYFLFFIHNSCSLLFLCAAARAHGEAGHERSGRGC